MKKPPKPPPMRAHGSFAHVDANLVDASASHPVCRVCSDTHTMKKHYPSEAFPREVMCTFCPTPCESCRQHLGAYCRTTPCECACHGKSRPALRPPLASVIDLIGARAHAELVASGYVVVRAADGRAGVHERDELRDQLAKHIADVTQHYYGQLLLAMHWGRDTCDELASARQYAADLREENGHLLDESLAVLGVLGIDVGSEYNLLDELRNRLEANTDDTKGEE